MGEQQVADDIDLIVKPLETLEEVWKWQDSSSYLKTSSVPLRSRTERMNSQPRTLVCHDMKGGYLDDRYVQGVSVSDSYRFFHWSHVDIFVYFSHSFITIPPPCWIDAAHLHGVPVLGTLITEDPGGTETCKKLFSGEDRHRIAIFIRKLVDIALHYKFEGWLINIENAIEPEHIQNLKHFLYWLTVKMQMALPKSYVIWYDSVTDTGELKWQNELNSSNRAYFDACDGIYLNYNWDEDKLTNSAKLAGSRTADVYVGVDVFGRGTPGGGGFGSDVAFKAIRKAGLSVALFAPGWVHEVLGEKDFTDNEYKYWSHLADLSPVHGPTMYPFSTSFCQGFGKNRFRYGKLLHENPWSNQSLQQFQPSYHSFYNKSLTAHKLKLSSMPQSAYNGGGCLELTGPMEGPMIPIFKLFSADLDFKVTLLCTYTFKCIEPKGMAVNMVLNTVNENQMATDWLLTHYNAESAVANYKRLQSTLSALNPVKVVSPASKEIAADLVHQGVYLPSEPENGWIKRCYILTSDDPEVKIKEISLYIELPQDRSSADYSVLLGQVQIIPMHMLLEHIDLSVACSHVAVGRLSSASQMEVSCIMTWADGNPTLLDSYDIYCGVYWTDPEGSPQSLASFVDSTRRNAYKMTAFPMHYPGTKHFRLRFIVQEHLYGIQPTDVHECPYAEMSFS